MAGGGDRTPREARDVGWYRDEAVAALARLRVAWPWLADLREPGPASPTRRFVSLRQAAAEAEQHQRDRRAQRAALSGGTADLPRPRVARQLGSRGTPTVPLGPHPDAARIGPITARSGIAAIVVEVTDELQQQVHGAAWNVTIYDPALRARYTTCGWCRDGILEAPFGWVWEWPLEAILCPRCGGRGTIPAGGACLACRSAGPCDCDATDAVVQAAFGALAETLPKIDDLDTASWAYRLLSGSDQRARRVARVVDEARRIQARCPQCSQLELWADVTSTDEREWSIACRNPLCTCTGPACRCGRPVRYEGRRHRWPQREWHGPGGFAERLGVVLPDAGGQRRSA